MTLEEMLARESIRQTMVRYTTAGDRLRLEEFLAVFTRDAILESEGVGEEDRFRYEGLQQIRQWLGRWAQRSRGNDSRVHQATFVRHHLSTSDIRFTDPGTAQATTYWTAFTDIGPDHCGYYLDTFRHTDEQWLIAHRRVRLDWRAEQSLFGSAVARTRAPA